MKDESHYHIKNNLSHLPHLCILEVCKHLTRHDLYCMGRTSRRMHTITNEQTLDKIKWKCDGGLVIGPTTRGYGFQLFVRYDVEKLPLKFKYQYEITETFNGFQEWKVRENFPIIKENTQEDFQFSSQLPEWPIPYYFFDALSHVIRHYGVNVMRLQQLKFNEELFSKLDFVLRGQFDIYLECCNMQCTEITSETRKSFVQLLKKVSRAELIKSSQITSLINEKFINEIPKSLRKFRCAWRPDVVHAHRFRPNISSNSRIIHMETLFATAMILDANNAIQIIMERMDKELKGKWMLSIDRQINAHIVNQQLQESNYEVCTYRRSPVGIYHFILENRINRKTTRISTQSIRMESGEITHFVVVDFYNFHHPNTAELIKD